MSQLVCLQKLDILPISKSSKYQKIKPEIETHTSLWWGDEPVNTVLIMTSCSDPSSHSNKP